NKGMMFFIIAFFFYNDGVGAVMTMATAYGMEIGLADVGPLTDGNGMILALFVTQIVAMPCSILFGKLANKYSSINLILFAIFIYFLICITGFIMGFGLELGWFDYTVAMILFWALAFMVGTVQGGIQATSRAVWARIIPPEHSGEYFGFYEISGRLSGFLGPLLYATILATTGSASLGIIPIALIFVTGFVLLVIGKKHINLRPVNEATSAA
ncbi:MAG: MFS transporter, partial [Oscillospiraceae bacterium]|nr:MFS transporter [Oscillospiraceae bacterium]MCL2280147.1 MFS transporter [Oscillospiraceae bacterium]